MHLTPISRHRQRQYVVQALYAADMVGDIQKIGDSGYDDHEIFERYFGWIKGKHIEKDGHCTIENIPYAFSLFLSACRDIDAIDRKWKQKAKRTEAWVSGIDKAILRSAIAEMFYNEGERIDPVVIIEEYIRIARMFSSEKAYGFVNGILDALRREQNGGKREEHQSD